MRKHERLPLFGAAERIDPKEECKSDLIVDRIGTNRLSRAASETELTFLKNSFSSNCSSSTGNRSGGGLDNNTADTG